jgi:predicted AAA+ superfamily ATPase
LLFLDNYRERLIIDEIQYAPELLPYLKIKIDKAKNKNGLYVLTGSQIFPLMQGIGESLAGRVGLFELLGFSWQELPEQKDSGAKKCFEQIYKGFYPRLSVQKIDAGNYYRSYIQTYIERDIRQVKSVENIMQFQMFLELLAARVGSLLNLSEISKECGISQPTARQWLSLLEITRIVYLLRPYFKNITKRVVKSPKVYFTDTGLLAYILKYQNADTLLAGPLAGAFFENMIIIELLKEKFNKQKRAELYFYRDSNHNEIDLIIDQGQKLKAVEIKMRKNIENQDLKTLQKANEYLLNCTEKFVISFREELQITKEIKNLPWQKCWQVL